MKTQYKNTFYKKKTRRADDPFVTIEVNAPRVLYAPLKLLSEEIGVPVGRLMLYALSNEFDSDNPFEFDLTCPDEVFEPYKYATEAARVVDLLRLFPKGVGLDTLVLCRKAAKIDNKDVFLLAIRELYNVEMIEEFYIKDNRFGYDEKRKLVRLKGIKEEIKLKKEKIFKNKEKGPLNE